MNKKSNRRDFIKNIVLASTSLAYAAPLTSSLTPLVSEKKVKLAFIGVGSRGQYLLSLILQQKITDKYDVVAICDNYQPNIQKALAIAKQYNIRLKVYKEHRELIKNEKLDGVIIATPLHEHAHISIDCMNAGIHVLCEKAMARNLDDVKEMYDTHRKTGTILLIGHQRIFNNVYKSAIQRIHSGELGTIGQIRAYWHRNNNWRRQVPENSPQLEKKINWRLYKKYSAGLLTELMSHQIQIANWALKQTPVSVMGTGSIRFWKDGREVDDNVAVVFSYPDGAQFVYDSMTSNKKHGLEEQILGSKGTMELETNRYFSEAPPSAPGILQLVNDIEKGIFNNIPIGGSSWIPETAVTYEGEAIFKNQTGDGTTEELVNFIKFIKAQSAPEWITKEGYISSIWTLLAEQAIESGTQITCPEKYFL